MKWDKIDCEIEYDWYELRCQLSIDNHLKVFLYGLKNQKNIYYLDFGKILFCRAIDEGWDLNPDEEKSESDEKQPHIPDGIFFEVTNSSLQNQNKNQYPHPIHHFQILGINFGLDVISEKLPLVIKE